MQPFGDGDAYKKISPESIRIVTDLFEEIMR